MSLLIPGAPHLYFYPSVAKAIGFNQALVLEHIKRTVDKSSDGGVFKTYEQWQKDFPFWSISTIRRAVYRLEKLGLIISKQQASTDRVKGYTIAEGINL